VPALLGNVPDKTPVDALIVNPEPELPDTDQVNGDVPPVRDGEHE